MKKSLVVFGALAMFAAVSFGGDPAIMIKQKAKDIANQNNERQGLPPSHPSSQPPASTAPAVPVTAAPTLTPQQQALARLHADLSAIKSEPSAVQIDQLEDDLLANAQGAKKPSSALIHKLANGLAAALAGRTLSPAQRGRMAQDIQAVLGGANLPQTQMDDIIADVPAILKKAGAGEKETAAVGDSLKTIAAEVRKKS